MNESAGIRNMQKWAVWGGGEIVDLHVNGKQEQLCEHSPKTFQAGDEIRLVDCAECGGWLLLRRISSEASGVQE